MPVPHTLGTKEEIDKIIKTYSQIYRLFFGRGQFFLMFIIGIAVSIFLVSQAEKSEQDIRSQTTIKEEKELVKKYNDLLEFEEINEDFDLHIQQGPLGYEGNLIESVDNYITYRGFVLPKKISVNKNIPLQTKEFFEFPNYNIKEIEIFMDNFIYITSQEAPENIYNNPKLQLPDNQLINYFKLECIKGLLLFKAICEKNTEDFLSSFYVYDLSNNYNQIIEIFDTLKTSPLFRKEMCEKLLLYVQYSNDNNQVLLPVMRECGTEYKDGFNAFSDFIQIQEQLNNTSINTQISPNKDLNAYKLISTMQSIFGELQRREFNQNHIISYINYVEEVLKKEGVEPFYYDVIYLFNNNYLEKTIIKNFINLKAQQTDKSQRILDGIRTLNKGNSLIGYDGLNNQVFNKIILQLKDNTKEVDFIEDTEPKESSLAYFNRVFSFDKYSVQGTAQIDNETIRVNGSYRFIENENEDQNLSTEVAEIPLPRKIDTAIIVKEKEGSFLVQRIESNDKSLEGYINNYVNNNDQSIQDLYFIIRDNRQIIQQGVEKIDICDRLNQNSKTRKQIIVCNDSEIQVQTSHPREKEIEIIYTVAHQEGIISSIETNDPVVKEQVQKDFDIENVSSITIIDFITDLIRYKTVNPNDRVVNYGEGQNEKVYIDGVIKKYLDISPESILEKNGSFLVEITINEVAMLVGYNIENDTIGPLVLRDFREVLFNDFDLSLTDQNIDKIFDFKTDPINYLEGIEADMVVKYRSLIETE